MLTRLSENIGKGLVAGLAGTALMTLSSTLEMKGRGRPASMTPAAAVEKVFDIEADNDAARERLSDLAHWAYGTSWGVARGVLDTVGIRGTTASAIHFALVWGAALVMLPALKVTPPVNEWGGEEIAYDALHHAVYAFGTGAVYDAF